MPNNQVQDARRYADIVHDKITANEGHVPTSGLLSGKGKAALVNGALAKIQAATGGSSGIKLASANASSTLGTLSDCDTYEELQALRLDMKAFILTAFNWDESNPQQATKAVMKAANEVLSTTNEDGTSRYQNGVEAIAFAMVAAPLFDANRIAELIRYCGGSATNAYAPVLYPVQLTSRLVPLFEIYKPDVRMRLMKNLWDEAHDDRWWSRAELTEGGANKAPVGKDVSIADQLKNGHVRWLHTSAEEMRNVQLTDLDIAKIQDRMKSVRSRSLRVALSYVPLASRHLPESTLEVMITRLYQKIDRLKEAYENQATLTDPPFSYKDALAEDPEKYYLIDTESTFEAYYSTPEIRAAFHNTEVRGLEGSSSVLMLDSFALQANGQHMGNCTWSLHGRYVESGSEIIGHMTYGDEEYNFAIKVGAQLSLGEVNTRYNRGGVPAEVSEALRSEVNRLNGSDSRFTIPQAVINAFDQNPIEDLDRGACLILRDKDMVKKRGAMLGGETKNGVIENLLDGNHVMGWIKYQKKEYTFLLGGTQAGLVLEAHCDRKEFEPAPAVVVAWIEAQIGQVRGARFL